MSNRVCLMFELAVFQEMGQALMVYGSTYIGINAVIAGFAWIVDFITVNYGRH